MRKQHLQAIEEHFAAAGCGDKRLDKRLVKTASALAKLPSLSLPEQFGSDKAGLHATYQLLDNDKLTPQIIQSGHRQKLLATCREHAVVLCVQDTTELDFTSHEVEGVGRIGNEYGRGILVHSALALSAEGRLLGLFNQIYHLRGPKKKETLKQVQSRWTETMLWSDTVKEVSRATLPGTRVIHIGDRGADRFDFHYWNEQLAQRFVIRASYDRLAGDNLRLWEKLETEPVGFCYELEVQERKKGRQLKTKRKALLEVSHTCVTIPPPLKDARYEHSKPVKMHAVYLREKNAPQGHDPIEWMLLSSEEVENEEQARQVIGYYKQRWKIEEWHRCLKQGCAMEDSQLKTAQRLERLAAIKSVIAVLLLQTRDQADDGQQARNKAKETLPPMHVKVLAKLCKLDEETMNVGEFWRALALHGGWSGWKNDPRPGWQILWRAWQSLDALVQGAKLFM